MAGSGRETANKTDLRRRQETSGDGERELPLWMRLYFYGMHGVTLDILLSSLQGAFTAWDPKLLGFSSPHLCVAHSLVHFALERIYSRKRCFRGRPLVFHLVFYPSVYVGLQILIGTVNTRSGPVSAAQLAAHYLLALYFCRVFHERLSRLRYRPGRRTPSGAPPPPDERSLPGAARFLFFGMQGLLDEVVFTSLFDLFDKSDRSLRGYTSPWSFLMYGSCSFAVERLYLYLRLRRGWATWQRLPLYVCVIYAWEFCWGLLLRQLGACSWDYSHYPHHVMGLITPLYLPGWVCLSLYQDVLSDALLRVRCSMDGGDGDGHPEEGRKTV